MAETKRRARGEDSIYYDRSRNRWVGTITVGWKPDGRRDRITVRGRTKTEVKDKLRVKHLELTAGVRTPANYTVEQCLKDWLETLNTQAESTVTGYRIMARHMIELIGYVKLIDLKVRDVDFVLGKLAKRLSTRSVRLARMILIQAIRNAMVNDLAVRNVADLAAVPPGKPGRPSRSLNLEQALAVLDAAKGERLWPYVAVSMLGGIRTEEARALRWSEVDLEVGTVAVYRSVRRTGETKTEVAARVPDPGHRRSGAAGAGPEAGGRAGEGRGGVEGEQPGVLHQPRRPDVRHRCADGAQADHREGGPRAGLDATGTAAHLRLAFLGFRSTHRADRGRGGPLQHPGHRGCMPAPAPAGDAYRCHRAWPAVRERRKDGRRSKLSVRLPIRLPSFGSGK
jgi:hypothetical protein